MYVSRCKNVCKTCFPNGQICIYVYNLMIRFKVLLFLRKVNLIQMSLLNSSYRMHFHDFSRELYIDSKRVIIFVELPT